MISGQRSATYGSDPVSNTQHYRSIVGALQYIGIIRLEFTYSVKEVSIYVNSYGIPLASNQKNFTVLAGTLDSGLMIQSSLSSQ